MKIIEFSSFVILLCYNFGKAEPYMLSSWFFINLFDLFLFKVSSSLIHQMRHQNDLETQKKAREKSVSVPIMTFFSLNKCLYKIMNQELFLCYVNIENIVTIWVSFKICLVGRVKMFNQEREMLKKRGSFMLLYIKIFVAKS